MPFTFLRIVAVTMVVAAAAAPPLLAQATGTLRGVIRDQGNAPLAGVEVLITSINRSAVTNEQGEFQLDNLPSRTFVILARLPGYSPNRIGVSIRDGETTEITLSLSRSFQVLEDIDVTENRRGLYGVVADTARRPLPGATVRVHGAGTQEVTDSAGRFAMPGVKPGAYALLVSHPDHELRRVHTMVPRGGSREIVVLLTPGSDDSWASYQLRDAMHDMGLRLNYYPSRLRLTEDELAKRGGMRLCDVPEILVGQNGSKSFLVNVVVNGIKVFRQVSLCDWRADEVALAEWGWNCQDVTGGVERLLGKNCDGPRLPKRPGPEPPYGTWVMIWTKQ